VIIFTMKMETMFPLKFGSYKSYMALDRKDDILHIGRRGNFKSETYSRHWSMYNKDAILDMYFTAMN
jgi:hypothetical protein